VREWIATDYVGALAVVVVFILASVLALILLTVLVGGEPGTQRKYVHPARIDHLERELRVGEYRAMFGDRPRMSAARIDQLERELRVGPYWDGQPWTPDVEIERRKQTATTAASDQPDRVPAPDYYQTSDDAHHRALRDAGIRDVPLQVGETGWDVPWSLVRDQADRYWLWHNPPGRWPNNRGTSTMRVERREDGYHVWPPADWQEYLRERDTRRGDTRVEVVHFEPWEQS